MKQAIKISISIEDEAGKERTIDEYLNACRQSVKSQKVKLSKAMQFINQKGLMKEFKGLNRKIKP